LIAIFLSSTIDKIRFESRWDEILDGASSLSIFFNGSFGFALGDWSLEMAIMKLLMSG
jgi:hypothetical protein